jgi:hypothetical protein
LAVVEEPVEVHPRLLADPTRAHTIVDERTDDLDNVREIALAVEAASA